MDNKFSGKIAVRCSGAWVSGLKDFKLYRIKAYMESISTVYMRANQ